MARNTPTIGLPGSWAHFRPTGQPISASPAATRYIQLIVDPPRASGPKLPTHAGYGASSMRSRALRIIMIAVVIVAVLSVTNVIYHVLRKPTELLSRVSGAFNKSPAETWHYYAPLFRE